MAMRKQTPRYAADQHIIELELENQRLREEIRVTHEAAELTAQLVIEQFEHNESIKGELRTTSYRLQAVLDAASQVAIIATDQQGLVGLCNRGAERMLSCGLGSLAEHKRMSDLLIAVSGLEDMSDYHLADLSVHCSSETCEAVMRRSNGDTFPVNLAVTSLHDGEGQTYGYLTVAMDITTLKQAEAQLQKGVTS